MNPLRVLLSVLVLAALAGPLEAAAIPRQVRFAVIYLDLDGTTLTSSKEIRHETLDALACFRRCGGRLGVATGRSRSSALRYLTLLKPDLPLVTYNGAIVTDVAGSKVLFADSLTTLETTQVLKAIPSDDRVRGVALYDRDGIWLDRPHVDVADWLANDSTPIKGEGLDLVELLATHRVSPIKLLVLTRWDSAATVRSTIQLLVGSSLRLVVSSEESVELLPEHANKADGIRHALEPLKLHIEDALVFGDSQNDVEMLKQAGAGFAMGNGSSDARQAAPATIGSHDTTALARAIRAFALMRNCPCESRP